MNGDTNTSLTAQPTVGTTAVTGSSVGTYPITASGAASSNYSISYTAGTLTVTQAALTITADNQSKVYGAANPTLTVTYAGFVNGTVTQAALTITANDASKVYGADNPTLTVTYAGFVNGDT
ncbi:MBG domain-containing protein, partial [Pedobacter borealis]|uniref:MBG domain-containing protein n=1 Tax=Pedobacter borealis TaxID=475254 RepID=UPI001FD82B78